jgi:hypothetical protein
MVTFILFYIACILGAIVITVLGLWVRELRSEISAYKEIFSRIRYTLQDCVDRCDIDKTINKASLTAKIYTVCGYLEEEIRRVDNIIGKE